MPIDYCLNYCDFSMNYCFQGCLNISFEDQRRIKAFFFSLQKVREKKRSKKKFFLIFGRNCLYISFCP